MKTSKHEFYYGKEIEKKEFMSEKDLERQALIYYVFFSICLQKVLYLVGLDCPACCIK